jgi:hypothetical protein
VPRQLVRAKRLFPKRRDSRTPTGQIEIGKVAGWVSHGASVLDKELDVYQSVRT